MELRVQDDTFVFNVHFVEGGSGTITLDSGAGVSEWRIQVFGRWGSAAVLKYVRDTIVDPGAVDIAARVVAAEPVPLGKVITHAFPTNVSKPQRVVVDRAAEKIAESLAKTVSLEKAASELLEECRRLEGRLAGSSQGQKLPRVVICDESQKAHGVANTWSTFCGWHWSGKGVGATTAKEEWTGAWCKTCAKRM